MKENASFSVWMDSQILKRRGGHFAVLVFVSVKCTCCDMSSKQIHRGRNILFKDTNSIAEIGFIYYVQETATYIFE